ncbi:MAG: PAS domain S-box protein [Candidatus Brocadiales bacterium]|nr:PAS domain S-box protein [Candidatus Brocadiales bacterium]
MDRDIEDTLSLLEDFQRLTTKGITPELWEEARTLLQRAKEIVLHTQTLKESEEHYKTVLENVSTAVVATDLEGNITSWNKGAEDIYAWKKEEILGKNIKVLFSKEDRYLLAQHQKRLLSGEKWRGEGQAIRKDGKTILHGFSLAPVRDSQGQPKGFVGLMADITEREKRQKEKRLVGNINRAIASSIDIKDLSEIINQELKKIIDFDTVKIVPSEEKGYIPSETEKRETLPVSSLLERVITTARPVVEEFGKTSTSPDGILSRLGFPLEYKGKTIGVLALESRKAGNFSPEQFDILWQIVPQLSLAIVNIGAYRDLSVQLVELQQLHRAALELIKELDLNTLREKIAASVTKLLKGSSSQVCIFDPEDPSRYEVSTHGIRASASGGGVGARCNVPLLPPAFSKSPYVIPEIEAESKLEGFKGILKEAGYKSLLSIPIPGKGRGVMGAITLFFPEPYHPKDFEMRMLEMYAAQASVALENARLFELVRRAKTQWEETFDSISELVTIHDTSFRILRANKAAAERFNTTPNKLVGQNCYHIFHGLNHPWPTCPMARTLQTRAPTMVEIDDPHLGGTFLMTTSPILGDNGEVIAVVHIAKDITEEKKLQDRLLQSEKLKALGEVASGVAHDFNNVLAIILGNVQLLQKSYENMEELNEGLQVVRRATLDGAETVQRLQEFTKLKTDVSQLLPLDIKKLVKEVIDFSRHRWKDMAQAKGITYKVDIKGLSSVPPILGNPAELREALLNIVNNALDAMPKGGTLTLRTWIPESPPKAESGGQKDCVLLSISDTGIGMSKEVQKKIFDPFFTTKGVAGSGLGMSVAYGIITRHGGEISVDSQLDKGSTITIKLPATRLLSEVCSKRSESSERASTSGGQASLKVGARHVVPLQVLVVDDEKEICRFLSKALTQEGHKVHIITSGAKAIKLLYKKSFDLLLCDLAMPDFSGWDVLEAVKILEKRPKVGIISGLGTLDSIKKEDLGADFIIGKPIDLEELTRLISQ